MEEVSIYNSRNYRSLLASGVTLYALNTIYNSRNYRSLLAISKDKAKQYGSTIVEIIEAY